jgi:hypothetical protein
LQRQDESRSAMLDKRQADRRLQERGEGKHTPGSKNRNFNAFWWCGEDGRLSAPQWASYDPSQ